jgi:predicted MFS family arabinose efflux permease
MSSGDAPLPGEFRWPLLALLLLGYIFNFLDRQILSILQIPLKAELHLSDTQLGLLGGTAFAILYSTLAIPLAALADRRGRLRVVAAGVAAWSLFTALCGLARSFPALFAARVGVGIGEAAGVAPSYALLSDAFPLRSRARAMAIFSLGIPFGAGLGIFFGGWLAQAFNWRTAFIVVGLGGVPVAVALAAFDRGMGRRIQAHSADQPRFLKTFRALSAKPSFWLLSFGAACASICGYGLGQWIPRMLHDLYGTDLKQLGGYFGSVIVVGGSAGILLSGALADRLSSGRPAAYALVPAAAFVLTVPLYLVAFYRPSLGGAWIWYVLPYMFSLMWLAPIIAAMQGLVRPDGRATASAMFLLINNLIGIGLGPLIFGVASDRLAPLYGRESLRLALTYGLLFYVLAAILCLVAALRIARDTRPTN